MSTIGDILDQFFSPFSTENLWVMPETDEYTVIVRQWSHVIASTRRAKLNLSHNCSFWNAHYITNPAWKPTMTDSPKPGAFRDSVSKPLGTEPEICKKAFIIYVASGVAKSVRNVFGVGPPKAIQTDELYTCSIGSFRIWTTVDTIDCAAKKATMNFWMFNTMSRGSFGIYADDPVFRLCGMKNQYMWWNWVETVEWTAGGVTTVPKPASGWNW